jgi:AraC-like DNA-binding protein
MNDAREWVRLYRLNSPHAVEIVHARYVRHRFTRHSHEHFVIGLVEDGVQQYNYRGANRTTPPGQVFFVNGGEPHTGEPAMKTGYLYRTLCIDPPVLRDLALAITGRSGSFYLTGDVVVDDPLSAALGQLHRAVATNAGAMQCESFLLSAVRCLLERHVENQQWIPAVKQEPCAVSQAREYIEAHYADDVSLADLGAVTCRSPFHIARAFSKEMGLPPHAYLESVRIQRAKEMLRAGMSMVDTALAVGYPDQSHFTHRFRRITGITPGRWRLSTKNLESRRPTAGLHKIFWPRAATLLVAERFERNDGRDFETIRSAG